LEVVRLPDIKRSFVCLPRRWGAEHIFARTTRFWGLARDYERLPQTLFDLHFAALACIMLKTGCSTRNSSITASRAANRYRDAVPGRSYPQPPTNVFEGFCECPSRTAFYPKAQAVCAQI
jgi:hypothetical protein